ncbi:hypothetical protein HYZ98_02985 [Candidatus Peregrinibacteria bacterium]|nr:hypothetical protein [Candidatus Peregrinibacteria bacterium]
MKHTFNILRIFAHTHDDLPAFHAGYLVLTFLVAAMFNMGTFALLVIAHMSLDIVKYREVHGYSWKRVIEGTVRESIVEVALLFTGLVFAVYFHHSVAGVAAVSGLMRAEFTVIRALGTIIPKVYILQDVLKIVAHIHHYLDSIHPCMHKEWTRLEKICLASFAASVLLLVIAPSILGLDAVIIEQIIREEIIPSLT